MSRLSFYEVRSLLSQGKSIVDIPLRVTFYARVSTDSLDQLNSLENQISYFENYIKIPRINCIYKAVFVLGVSIFIIRLFIIWFEVCSSEA